MYSREQLEHIFSYHEPDDFQTDSYNHIRIAALAFAIVVVDNTPVCADQTAAIRKIREAVMTANEAIALGGKS